MIKKQIKKSLKIIFYPLALIIFFITAFLKGGVKKIKAQGIICDPVHEPPVVKAIEYLSQKPVTIISILVILIFPVYLFRVIKQFFTTQFSTWQLTRRVIKHCFVWSFLYYLLLAIVFILVSKMGLLENYYSYQSDLTNAIFIILLFIPVFLILNLISGIELLLISIKDRRFLVSGLILFFVPILLFAILFLILSSGFIYF
jgi:hypothetical protein